MTDFSTWSLDELKAAAECTDVTMLTEAVEHYRVGAQAAERAGQDFLQQMSALREAWEGRAATAAIEDAHRSRQTMGDTHTSSSSSHSTTSGYASRTRESKSRMSAIPNVDTSWGHAVATAGWGGLVGIGVQKYEQQKQYDQNRTRAASIASQMDSDGTQQATSMRSTYWPSPQGRAGSGSPPSSLPPVPGSSGGGSAGPSYSGPTVSGGQHTSAYTPTMIGPTTSPQDNEVFTTGWSGPHSPHGPSGPSTTPSGNGTPPPDLPVTTPQSASVPWTNGAPADGMPTEALPPQVGVSGGGGAAAAALGGAGLLGAGALGGRAFAGSGAGETGLRRGPAGLAEGEGGVPRASGGFGEGEAGLRRGASGMAESDASLRSGARVGSAPQDELGTGRRGLLRGAGADGFAGEPVAGEAGRMGGYPAGGAGARRRNDDEEAPVPDYLVETDDVWGDGVSAAPPVIGE